MQPSYSKWPSILGSKGWDQCETRPQTNGSWTHPKCGGGFAALPHFGTEKVHMQVLLTALVHLHQEKLEHRPWQLGFLDFWLHCLDLVVGFLLVLLVKLL